MIVTGLSESQCQLGWLASLWCKEPIEKSGAIIIADMNFKELLPRHLRRRRRHRGDLRRL